LQIEATGGQAITFGGDVSKEEDVESMMKAVSAVCLCKENGFSFTYTSIGLCKLGYYLCMDSTRLLINGEPSTSW
jgi:hypothetical protein